MKAKPPTKPKPDFGGTPEGDPLEGIWKFEEGELPLWLHVCKCLAGPFLLLAALWLVAYVAGHIILRFSS